MNFKLSDFITKTVKKEYIKENEQTDTINITDNIKIIVNTNTLEKIKLNKIEDIKIENVANTISKIVKLSGLDEELVTEMFLTSSGNLDTLCELINQKYKMNEIWTSSDDQIILSSDLNKINELIEKLGFNEVMKRSRFLHEYADNN
jgi:hypothetical protein